MEPYSKAFELEQERVDRNNYYLGFYMMSAVGAVLSSALGGKKGSYLEEPLFVTAKKEKEMESLTEEQKMVYVEQLFGKLETMQTNFELNKSNKENKGKTESLTIEEG